ncbi:MULTISPECIES: AEC family transporter [Salinibaculum]|uniref:AEC family transporter n=1 Tax=Salinibaculum TaxID=2732368 RepID=UPI0030CF6304
MSLLSIFGTAILPIVAIAAAGYLLGRTRDISATPLNTVTVYVLVPALVFHTLTTTQLAGETLASIVLGVFLFTGVMAVLAQGTGTVLGNAEPILGTFVLVSVFSNAGNYGIPVSEFAFGALGRSTAVVYIVGQSVAMYTLGVYLAARGEGSDWREGMRAIFSIPLIYTVLAALAARYAGVVPPADTAAMETLQLVGDSAIPVMLLILGIELAETDYSAAALQVTPAVGLKLLVAPVVAVGVALLVGFQNPTVARVFVLESAMPAAVTTLILTGEFAGPNADGIAATEYASTAIFVSTVISVPLLTGLIALLQSGVVL